MSSNPAEIGERIKAARRAANLSQTELAKRLDKTMRTIQKYESGEIEPSIAMINAIAKVLDVSPADLIGYRKPEIQLDSLSDVIAVLYQLEKWLYRGADRRAASSTERGLDLLSLVRWK